LVAVKVTAGVKNAKLLKHIFVRPQGDAFFLKHFYVLKRKWQEDSKLLQFLPELYSCVRRMQAKPLNHCRHCHKNMSTAFLDAFNI